MDIHLVQMAIARGKPELNRAKVLALTAPLPAPKPGNPSLIVLPEVFSTGWLDGAAHPGGPGAAGNLTTTGPDAALVASVAAADREFLAGLARKSGSWVAGTTVEAGPAGADGNGGYRNLSLLYAPDGSEHAVYRKLHPFSFGGEDRLFEPGREIVVTEIEGWVVQSTICYDLRFPELYRAGSRRGAHLILVQANWPSSRHLHWETLLRARAIENQAFVAGVNCTGSQDGLAYSGASVLFNPKGEAVVQGDAAEGVLRGKADLDQCKQWRKQFPALRDRLPWDLFSA